MRNPPSTQQYGPYNLYIRVGSLTSLVCPVLTSTVSTPGTLTGFGITPSNLVISSSVTRSIAIALNNPISNSVDSTYPSVMIEYSTGPTITYTGNIYNFKPNTAAFTFTKNLTTSSPITLTGFSWVNPTSTLPYTLTITTFMNISNVAYKIDTRTNTYSTNAGVMTATISPLSQPINSASSYKFTITTINNLVSGSYINVVVPSELTASSGSCTSTTVVGATCSSSQNNVTLVLNSAVAGATAI